VGTGGSEGMGEGDQAVAISLQSRQALLRFLMGNWPETRGTHQYSRLLTAHSSE
jgi:hypothetical protein